MKAWKNIENPNTIWAYKSAPTTKKTTQLALQKKIYCDAKYIIERLLLYSQ